VVLHYFSIAVALALVVLVHWFIHKTSRNLAQPERVIGMLELTVVTVVFGAFIMGEVLKAAHRIRHDLPPVDKDLKDFLPLLFMLLTVFASMWIYTMCVRELKR